MGRPDGVAPPAFTRWPIEGEGPAHLPLFMSPSDANRVPSQSDLFPVRSGAGRNTFVIATA